MKEHPWVEFGSGGSYSITFFEIMNDTDLTTVIEPPNIGCK